MENHISRKRGELIFILINIVLIAFSVYFTHHATSFFSSEIRATLLFIVLILYLVIAYLLSIYNMDSIKYGVQNVVITVVFNGVFMLLFSSLFFTRQVALSTFIISAVYQIAYKWIMVRNLAVTESMLVIVSGDKQEKEMRNHLGGVKNLIEYKIGRVINIHNSQLVLEEFLNRPLEFIQEYKITCIVVENEKISGNLERVLFELKMQGIKIKNALDLFEYIHGKVHIREIDFKWFLFYRGFDNLNSSIYRKSKRFFDLAFAIVILAVTSPVILLTAIAIKLESKGPVFFKQERIGLSNKLFTIIKMRSMCQDAEKDGAKWASKGDARITRVGKFIRKTRIDELPQCINIMKGEMSFVGPRPERDVFIQELKKIIPFYDVRHIVKPGVTGWAQTKYRYGSSIEDAEEKLKYDLYYIKHSGLWLDLAVLFQTVKTVLMFKGN